MATTLGLRFLSRFYDDAPNAIDDDACDLVVVEQRVVAAMPKHDALAVSEERILHGENDFVGAADDRNVWDVRARAFAKPRQELALRVQIRTDQERKILCAFCSAERRRERDGLRDALIAAQLVDIPARDQTAETVPDDVNARGARNAIDELRQAERDALHADARNVRERCGVHAAQMQTTTQRTKHSGRRQKSVHENHDVLTLRVREHRRKIERPRDDLAQRRNRLDAQPLPFLETAQDASRRSMIRANFSNFLRARIDACKKNPWSWHPELPASSRT